MEKEDNSNQDILDSGLTKIIFLFFMNIESFVTNLNNKSLIVEYKTTVKKLRNEANKLEKLLKSKSQDTDLKRELYDAYEDIIKEFDKIIKLYDNKNYSNKRYKKLIQEYIKKYEYMIARLNGTLKSSETDSNDSIIRNLGIIMNIYGQIKFLYSCIKDSKNVVLTEQKLKEFFFKKHDLQPTQKVTTTVLKTNTPKKKNTPPKYNSTRRYTTHRTETKTSCFELKNLWLQSIKVEEDRIKINKTLTNLEEKCTNLIKKINKINDSNKQRLKNKEIKKFKKQTLTLITDYIDSATVLYKNYENLSIIHNNTANHLASTTQNQNKMNKGIEIVKNNRKARKLSNKMEILEKKIEILKTKHDELKKRINIQKILFYLSEINKITLISKKNFQKKVMSTKIKRCIEKYNLNLNMSNPL